MASLVATITALAVSLAVIPVMVHLAPALGMLDQPDPRKVHLSPVPRVGGWGVVGGALLSVLIWLPFSPLALAFLTGALILFLGGALDDSRDLRPTIKLALQLVAVVPVVGYAGLVVSSLPVPFAHELALPGALALGLTTVGLVACINAANTSDGLDGLAGGETLLSLFGILYLALAIENHELLFIAGAAAGGLFGFLRYNTHPAVIFMGDSGSQFLGFTVAFLGLALVQPEVGGYSPWTILMIIGLPLIDLAVVAIGRLLRGVSCFRADRTHVHHRLLDLGLSHNRAVILIYGAQASFVLFGLLLLESPASATIAAYVLHIAVVYGLLAIFRRLPRHFAFIASDSAQEPQAGVPMSFLVWAPRVYLALLVPMILVICAAFAASVPSDYGILGTLLILALIMSSLRYRRPRPLLARLPVFLTVTAVLYLYTDARQFSDSLSLVAESLTFVSVALATAIAIKFTPQRRQQQFYTKGIDYLVVLVLFSLLVLTSFSEWVNIYFFVYLPIILYASEIVMIDVRRKVDWLPLGSIAAASVLVLRSVL
jgi:UDP-GlcNAc:undecaprenyl-phosphate/decaprenyl-phosphate GlcNAc-1-phosphate transferase